MALVPLAEAPKMGLGCLALALNLGERVGSFGVSAKEKQAIEVILVPYYFTIFLFINLLDFWPILSMQHHAAITA
jgi:hypothetical protein